MKPLTVVPHLEGGPMHEVWEEVRKQCPLAHRSLTPLRRPFAYGDLVRRLWHAPDGFILVEADVIPPPGALLTLAHCREPWCSHPHWMGDHYGTETFGIVKLSGELTRAHPWLVDTLYAAPDPRYWVRRGWTDLDPDCSPVELNTRGRRACLRPDAPAIASHQLAVVRPTTHGWLGLDTTLARELKAMGIPVHVHDWPTRHLHDYEARPPGSDRHWWQMERDEIDWP